MHWKKPLCLALLAASATTALAHGDTEHAPARVKFEQKPWGIAGEARSVRRTIEVKLTDDMRFTPDRVEVKQGETIRFVHKNMGTAMHEFVLGTKAELDEHAALMKKFPGMEHDEPYMAHVPPGQQRELIWTFNRSGDFDFACLLPGHYEAGMRGKVDVTPIASKRSGERAKD